MLSVLYLLSALLLALPACAVALRRGQAPRLLAPLFALPAMGASLVLPQLLGVEGALFLLGLALPALRAGLAGGVGLGLHALACVAILDAVRRTHRAEARGEGTSAEVVFTPLSRRRLWFYNLLFRAPSSRAVEQVRGVPYREVGGRTLRTRIYRPRGAAGPLPAVVYFHGGGWITGRPGQSWLFATELAAAGYVVFSPRYRLAPRHPLPAAIEDAKAVVAWVRAEAVSLGVDPDRIYAAGASAGGHLAAMVALSANAPVFQPGFEAADTRVAGAICYYGAVDVLAPVSTHRHGLVGAFFELLVFRSRYAENPDLFRLCQPATWATPSSPPLLLVHGGEDELVPADVSLQFFLALRALGAPVELVEIPGAWHAFTVHPTPAAWVALQESLAFLRRIGGGLGVAPQNG